MPLNPGETRATLQSLEHWPDRKLGQNFLVDGNIVRKSLELAAVASGDTVVEIGPGLGTLSRALLEAGAAVHAIELDPVLARHLRTALPQGTFHLLEGDCLDAPLAGFDPQANTGPFKVVANLPYAVATPWMDALLSGPLPERMVLMLQKEAADRYAAVPGGKQFGAISIFLQAAYTIAAWHKVAPTCFMPPPKVDSVLLRIDRRLAPFSFGSRARACIRRLFTQRRKQLGSLCRKDPDPLAAAWFERLVSGGFPPDLRPESVPVEAWTLLQP